MKSKKQFIEEIDYRPDDWILDKKDKPIVNLKKQGKCVYMYLSKTNHQQLLALKKKWKKKTWNAFITRIIQSKNAFSIPKDVK